VVDEGILRFMSWGRGEKKKLCDKRVFPLLRFGERKRSQPNPPDEFGKKKTIFLPHVPKVRVSRHILTGGGKGERKKGDRKKTFRARWHKKKKQVDFCFSITCRKGKES